MPIRSKKIGQFLALEHILKAANHLKISEITLIGFQSTVKTQVIKKKTVKNALYGFQNPIVSLLEQFDNIQFESL